MFAFKFKYPQSFLDELAKAHGITWTPVDVKTIKREDIPVKPLSAPRSAICYFDMKYGNDKKNKPEEY